MDTVSAERQIGVLVKKSRRAGRVYFLDLLVPLTRATGLRSLPARTATDKHGRTFLVRKEERARHPPGSTGAGSRSDPTSGRRGPEPRHLVFAPGVLSQMTTVMPIRLHRVRS
jgi:hypothetical protein